MRTLFVRDEAVFFSQPASYIRIWRVQAEKNNTHIGATAIVELCKVKVQHPHFWGEPLLFCTLSKFRDIRIVEDRLPDIPGGHDTMPLPEISKW